MFTLLYEYLCGSGIHCNTKKNLNSFTISPSMTQSKNDWKREAINFTWSVYFRRGNVFVPLQISTYPATTLLDGDANLHHFTWLGAGLGRNRTLCSHPLGEPQPFGQKENGQQEKAHQTALNIFGNCYADNDIRLIRLCRLPVHNHTAYQTVLALVPWRHACVRFKEAPLTLTILGTAS